MNHDPDYAFSDSTELNQTIKEVAEMAVTQDTLDTMASRILKRTTLMAQPPKPASLVRRSSSLVPVTLALVAAALVITFLLLSHTGSGVAFAQAQQQVEKTGSVQYVEYMHPEDAKEMIAECRNLLQETTLELAIEEAREAGQTDSETELKKKYEEFSTRIKEYANDLETKLSQAKPIESKRVWIQGRYLQREEETPYGEKMIRILNAETGEHMTLDVSDKRCTFYKSQTTIGMKSGEKTVLQMKPQPNADFYSRIAAIPSKDVRELPGKLINGKQTVGFEQVGENADTIFIHTYWIDKETRLPVQIDDVMKQGDTVIGGATRSQFVFDQPVDASMFSTIPPEGYTVKDGTILGLDIEK
jgi:outer membrane lipoprotein-sorting protein